MQLLTNLWLCVDNVPTKFRNVIDMPKLRNQLERHIIMNSKVKRCEVVHASLGITLTLIDPYTGRGAKWGISRIRVNKSLLVA